MKAASDIQKVVETLEDICRQIYPRKRVPPLTLKSSLDRDAGIDSLGRMELLARLEERFNISLPDASVVSAETVEDLIRAIDRAVPRGTRTVPSAPVRRAPPIQTPEQASTFQEALEWHVKHHAERPHIALYGELDVDIITYGDLFEEAKAVAAGLREDGVSPGQPVALILPTCREYFSAFFGVLLAGGVPVPLYPPHRASKIEEHVRRQARILSNAQAKLLIAAEETARVGRLLRALLPELRGVRTVEELRSSRWERIALKPDDAALLQYTSGSTGNPKGVVLTHANLLANIRAMVAVSGATSADTFVSWLPLYHDMGLIGAWLGSLYLGSRAALMSPILFLARPERWLRMIHSERASISAAPNFAYDLCANKLADATLEGIDLGSWRLAFNGAEKVHAATIDRFCDRFGKYGFRRKAMTPVYGLAENTLGVTFPPAGRGPLIQHLRRRELEAQGCAVPTTDDPDAIRVVSCGRALPGHEVRIVDASGHELPDGVQGRLQFRGPSATRGYFRNPDANRALLEGEWLNSGDNAYVSAGEIFITGRVKDLIIRGGRNIHPEELEAKLCGVPGVRKGCVAVFGVNDPRSGTERLIVAAETRLEGREREQLATRLRDAAAELLEGPPDEVLLLEPRRVPKTPNGKIQRHACRELYERGRLGRSAPLQFARIGLASVRPGIRRLAAAARRIGYVGYAWAVYATLATILWILVAAVPVLQRRRSLVRYFSRWMLRLIGVRVSVSGTLPEGPGVIAANHASYLDGVILASALPGSYGFTAKRELSLKWYSRIFMRRLGVTFVERFEAGRGIQDVAAIAETLRGGDTVIVFPEGTFTRAPGLRPFRMGAFVAAAQADVPVIPVSLRGTRSILRGDEWLPRPGRVGVCVSPPVRANGKGWDAASRLHDEVREILLNGCGEPDLTVV